MNENFNFLTENFESIAVLFTVIVAIVYAIVEVLTKKQTKSEYIKSFEKTIANLSSTNIETQLSAAILLRRYLNVKMWFKPFLHDEAVNVISSLLRTLPTGIYQKTLGDGLAYAKGKGLSENDMQKTNLQNLYLGNKRYRLQCFRTDFYMSDLSYALLENIDGKQIIFYNAILMCANIKNCDFSNANFVGADLTNTYFKNVILNGANFTNAINLSPEIGEKLINGIYQCNEPVTTNRSSKSKTIFFSMPGIMTKKEEMITKSYKELLEKLGFEVFYYGKDDYPQYGQLNSVRKRILSSCGIIAFGFKQINIINGLYRSGTDAEKVIKNLSLSTPWSEIEVGMALMKGLPILLVHDKEVTSGIFDNILSEYFIGEISSEFDIRKIGTNKTFESWLKKLEI